MLTKTLSEAKKKQRNILIKAMNNDIGSVDSDKDSWNPAQISEQAKDISYIRSLVDTWNPAQLNEALRMLDLPIIDTWNPAQIEEQRRNLVFYLAERTLTGNPITLNILGSLTPEVTGLKVTMNPIQDLHGYSNPWACGAGANKFGGVALRDRIVELGGDADTQSLGVGWCSIGSSLLEGKALYSNFKENTQYTLILRCKKVSGNTNSNIRFNYTDNTYSWIYLTSPVTDEQTVVAVSTANKTIANIGGVNASVGIILKYNECGVFEGVKTASDFTPYENICPISGRTEASVTRTAGEDEETKTHQYSETIYGGVDDFVNGGLSVEWGYIASYDGETLPDEWISDRDAYAPDTTPSTGAEVAYRLATPTTIETSAEEIKLLKGTNVLSTDGDSIELKYKQNF